MKKLSDCLQVTVCVPLVPEPKNFEHINRKPSGEAEELFYFRNRIYVAQGTVCVDFLSSLLAKNKIELALNVCML